MIPSLTIKFFQPSYLRRYSNLSSPYEVNLILRSFSVFISFQESLAIWLVDRSRLKLKANEKGRNCCESVFLSFFFFSNKHSNIRRSRLENKLGGREYRIFPLIPRDREIYHRSSHDYSRRILLRSLFTSG